MRPVAEEYVSAVVAWSIVRPINRLPVERSGTGRVYRSNFMWRNEFYSNTSWLEANVDIRMHSLIAGSRTRFALPMAMVNEFAWHPDYKCGRFIVPPSS